MHALKACSKRASREDRLRLIFAIFDVDNDGVVSAEDLELMVRQLAGRSLAYVPAFSINAGLAGCPHA